MKLLIANRGEIARRIIRSARHLGIDTVAVYSEADRGAPHTKEADEAYYVGPAAASESYLNQQSVLDIITASGCTHCHPGYGFLAENPTFAAALEKHGCVFVGPSAAAMERLGHKDAARALAEQAGVPVVPGVHIDTGDDETFMRAASKLNFPILLKARAGGGGKGMRVVSSASELSDAMASARREGKAFFDDGQLIAEERIYPARHIEIQVIADTHGSVATLFERECSLQRRHQKIIEETPAVGIAPELRQRLYEAAASLTKAAGLHGAATIEFILPMTSREKDDPFYFLEANCRIQVEHPVTEETCGVDLVALQLRIASGESLSTFALPQTQNGFSLEARVYAELPAQNFIPAAGTITSFTLPEGPGIRVDHTLAEELGVTTHYDPMLAKVIVHADTRQSAIQKLRYALRHTVVLGVETNIPFLITLCDELSTDGIDTPHTTFIDERLTTLTDNYDRTTSIQKAVATYLFARQAQAACSTPFAFRAGDTRYPAGTHSPHRPSERIRLHSLSTGLDSVLEIQVLSPFEYFGDTCRFEFRLGDDVSSCSISRGPGEGSIRVQIGSFGEPAPALWHREHVAGGSAQAQVSVDGQNFLISPGYPSAETLDEQELSSEGAYAPLPGKVISVRVAAGDQVSVGDTLCVIESMKMEHAVTAHIDARIEEIFVTENTPCEKGALLIRFNGGED